MRRSGQHSRVQAGLALFLHAQRYLRRKSSRMMIQKPGSAVFDLRVSVSYAAHPFSCSVRQFFGRISDERRFSAAELAARRFFSRSCDNLFPARRSLRGFPFL
ncbi:hypothetical protein NDU88_005367 [Pleurodeles waltl]|uniref:Uncharacterized protein n=1 Tax=Pleurodeles waltl TaxID=8319 RepID=A0AAV7TBD5_PLEWA|nr:hypothetical protein NDU88_005367 [Pleurodeles waltl]